MRRMPPLVKKVRDKRRCCKRIKELQTKAGAHRPPRKMSCRRQQKPLRWDFTNRHWLLTGAPHTCRGKNKSEAGRTNWHLLRKQPGLGNRRMSHCTMHICCCPLSWDKGQLKNSLTNKAQISASQGIHT